MELVIIEPCAFVNVRALDEGRFMNTRSRYPALHFLGMANGRRAPADIGRHVWKYKLGAKQLVIILGVFSVMVFESYQVVVADVAARFDVTLVIVQDLGSFVCTLAADPGKWYLA